MSSGSARATDFSPVTGSVDIPCTVKLRLVGLTIHVAVDLPCTVKLRLVGLTTHVAVDIPCTVKLRLVGLTTHVADSFWWTT